MTELKKLSLETIGIDDENLELILKLKIDTLIYLNNILDKINEAVEKAIGINEHLASDIKLLKSIDGIGDKTAKDFMLELVSIDNFASRKELTAYIGTDPGVKQSGVSLNVNGRITKRGNAYLRRTIYLMALGVIRYDTNFKNYYNKKISEGKRYKQAVIAVANKLIRLIFSILKSKTIYEPTRY